MMQQKNCQNAELPRVRHFKLFFKSKVHVYVLHLHMSERY